MHIDHIAFWVEDLEVERAFFEKYFRATCDPIYENKSKQYKHYFLNLDGGNCRLEIMAQPGHEEPKSRYMQKGLAHICLTIGSRQDVMDLTQRLRADGLTIISEPRLTGGGSFEAAVLDPEGNYIEYAAQG